MGNTQQRYEKYFIYFYLIDKKKHLLLESSPNILLSRYIIYGSFIKCVDVFCIVLTEETKLLIKQKHSKDSQPSILLSSSDIENYLFLVFKKL